VDKLYKLKDKNEQFIDF